MTHFIIISAIVCFIIVFLLMLNMYEKDYYNHIERIKVPLYAYILAVIGCIIPIFNIIATIIYIAYCICQYEEDYMIIKGPLGKIGNFFNKKL